MSFYNSYYNFINSTKSQLYSIFPLILILSCHHYYSHYKSSQPKIYQTQSIFETYRTFNNVIYHILDAFLTISCFVSISITNYLISHNNLRLTLYYILHIKSTDGIYSRQYKFIHKKSVRSWEFK